MAHNSDAEDLNGINDDSLEFNSEDDNFDFLDDESKPTPMTDVPPINCQFNDTRDTNSNKNNVSTNFNNTITQPQKTNNFVNSNIASSIGSTPYGTNNVSNNTNGNINPSSKSGVGGLKLLNKGLINKNSVNYNQNNNNLNMTSNNYYNENSSTNFMNKSDISFPPLPSQSSIYAQQQPSNIPLNKTSPIMLQNNYNRNNNDTGGSNQSIPGIPVIESSSGNFSSSIQNSLFTKNENGSTIINFPPLKGENDKKVVQTPSSSATNLNSQDFVQSNGKKIINFPPLKGEDSSNQQPKINQQENEQKDPKISMQLPSINNIDQSQSQQSSQIRVNIKPKFLLKQQPQSASKPQVSFSQTLQPQNQTQNSQQSKSQIQNTSLQPANPSPVIQQQTEQIQNNQQQPQNPIQNVENNQLNQTQIQNFQQPQQQQMIFNNNNNNNNPINTNSAATPNSSFPSNQQQIQSTYILTPVDRVAISFNNKLDLSLLSLRRSIASEISSSLRRASYTSSVELENNKSSSTNEHYSFTGRLPSSFDNDIDNFLDNLNSELVNAVSFAPLLGINDGSFSASMFGNGLYSNNILSAPSVSNTEVTNVSNINENNNNTNNNNVYTSGLNKNSYLNSLNVTVNMNYAAERYASVLSQNINNVFDENLRSITSGLAASSIIENQMCTEQAKSLRSLKKEVSSLRSLFKSSVNQILEKLNQEIASYEIFEQEDNKKKSIINRTLSEMRYKRKDLQAQIEKQAIEKEKIEIALKNLAEKRKKMFLVNFSKNGIDMKLNKLIKVIENIENEMKDEVEIFNSSSNVNNNLGMISRDLNSYDSKRFNDLAESLKYAEKIMSVDEESMRIHLMESTASTRWISSSLSTMSRFVENENISNSRIGNRSQLQLTYSPSRRSPKEMMSPRRESRQSFI